MRATESANICQFIHDTANRILAALADFGCDADLLKDQQDKIDAFNGNVSAPRTARTTNRASNEMLEAEFETAMGLLDDQLDKLMVRFKKAEPEFYAEYVAAREIVDNPGGHAGKNGNGNGSHTVAVPAVSTPTVPEPVPVS